jgi:hypothetical protein
VREGGGGNGVRAFDRHAVRWGCLAFFGGLLLWALAHALLHW